MTPIGLALPIDEGVRVTLAACREYLAGDAWLYPGATVAIDGLRVHITPARERLRRELLRAIEGLLQGAKQAATQPENIHGR